MEPVTHIPKTIKHFLSFIPTLGLLLLCQNNVYGQDVQFSIPEFVPLYINPASSGEFDKYRANLNYRSQWKSVGTPFTTMSASFDMLLLGNTTDKPASKGRLGAGVNFLTDKLGPDGQKVFAVNTSMAYHVRLTTTSTLGGGLSIGFDQRSISSDDQWGSQFNGIQYDPNISSGEAFGSDAESNLDLSAGIIYHSSKESKKRGWNLNRQISFGIAAYHLGRINLSESQYLSTELKPRYSFFTSLQLPFGEKIAALPQIYYQQQNGITAAFFGCSVKYLVISGNSFMADTEPMLVQAGIYMRNNEAFTLSAGIDWSKYSLIIAYDFSRGQLKSYSSGRGGYEIGLRWRMNEKKKR